MEWVFLESAAAISTRKQEQGYSGKVQHVGFLFIVCVCGVVTKD